MISLAPRRARKFAAKLVSNGFNAGQAVIDCGLTKNRNSAYVTGHRLLKHAKVKEAIEQHLMSAKISADEILEELSVMARAPVEKVSEAGKLKALELSGKAQRLFVDKVESTDTTERDATVIAITDSIDRAAQRSNVSTDLAAIHLFNLLDESSPARDLAHWGKYRGVIEADLAEKAHKTAEPDEVGGEM
jgi:hypothetical protein